ncbi:nuclear transport factor 2 family protein [Isoptericola sp. S6320L]|uniref:nuclear transport factor 2 family protein n=1 Tax=Isoptericola sp. S6320L TaxID=2926411 RepID=UPI001FF55160|nr:nuclear transport factor 2 family protein [Isoptericola sp. S6320L]MCK0115717.1 nuclear transport factor 2 family protein [Isoptericola sp. S6320L]
MRHDQVVQWVDRYERAWRENDAGAVADLFTPEASYARSPYERALLGQASIQDFWTTDAGATFTMTAEPLAVDGVTAVVRVGVHYTAPESQEYKNLWVLRFADDGRVADFEEWPFWPGRPYSAGGGASDEAPVEPGPTPEI